MKVKHLIEMLEKEDQEKEIILQKDPEGNGYSPLGGVDIGTYLPDTREMFSETDHEFLFEEGYLDEDTKIESVIVLYPLY